MLSPASSKVSFLSSPIHFLLLYHYGSPPLSLHSQHPIHIDAKFIIPTLNLRFVYLPTFIFPFYRRA